MIDNSCEVKKWKRIKGDLTLRLNYELDANSVVIDVGGYTGGFAYSISSMYGSKIFIFEPVEDYYKGLLNRFKYDPNIHILNYAIGGENKKYNLVFNRNASHLEPGDKINTKVKSFSEIYEGLSLDTVDLLKLNVEGAEYDILNNIIDNNLIKNIKNIQVQFHYHLLDEPQKTLNSIREKLSETHYQTWKYEWVWENWRIKDECV